MVFTETLWFPFTTIINQYLTVTDLADFDTALNCRALENSFKLNLWLQQDCFKNKQQAKLIVLLANGTFFVFSSLGQVKLGQVIKLNSDIRVV